jgi:hypothetical protein
MHGIGIDDLASSANESSYSAHWRTSLSRRTLSLRMMGL